MLDCYILRQLDGKNARLADYFDVITGASTGGLIEAMLTAPDKQRRPLYMAKDIVPFYLKHCPKIFPQSWYIRILSVIVRHIHVLLDLVLTMAIIIY